MSRIEQVRFSSEIDRIEASVDEILRKYAEYNGLGGPRVLQHGRTMKSVYGKVIFDNGTIRYFKLSHADKIRKEINAYGGLYNWKHEALDKVFYLGDLGLYTQNFFHGKYGTCIMEDVCQVITGESDLTIDTIKSECGKIFEGIGNNYRDSIIHASREEGGNDIFYRGRIEGENSWIQGYGKLLLPNVNGTLIPLSQIYNTSIIVNGGSAGLTIGKIFQDLQEYFNGPINRKMVLSQGDLTENNITLDGNFYDFETGGLNSLWQDVAITVHYLMIAGHYITPKYSNSAKSLQINTDKLFNSFLSPTGTISISENKELHVNVDFRIPEVKQVMLSEYLRVMTIMGFGIQNGFDDFKKALTFRFLASKNLASVSEKDRIMLLSLVIFIYSRRNPEELLEFINQ